MAVAEGLEVQVVHVDVVLEALVPLQVFDELRPVLDLRHLWDSVEKKNTFTKTVVLVKGLLS